MVGGDEDYRLKKDDVFVTNKSDKQAQLPKILKLGHIEEESIVDMRTTTRINDKGEPVKECKVRFKGYGQADDEWIPDKYVKKALKTAWNDEAPDSLIEVSIGTPSLDASQSRGGRRNSRFGIPNVARLVSIAKTSSTGSQVSAKGEEGV